MPTLHEWEAAMGFRRSVRIESSASVIADVQHKQALRDAKLAGKGKPVPNRKPLATVPQFAPSLNVSVEPISLLHRLGTVTTPPIENLADLCSSWAYYRYLWAFAPSPATPMGPLALSRDAKNIDFHQKGLLSDQIGVGMAATLMDLYFRAPLAADVDVAMNDPAWPIDLQFDTSPDYLFFSEDHAQLFVVECKGAQSSRTSVMDQLRRGAEQVPSLVFMDGRRPTQLVIATHLGTDGTTVYVVDPPSEDEVRSLESPTSAKRVSEREYQVRDSEQFRRSSRLISEAKLLAYAGSDQAAAAKLEQAKVPLPRLPHTAPRDLSVTETELGKFSGITQSLPVRGDVRVDAFQGLEVGVREAYIADDVPRLKETLTGLQQRSRLAADNVHAGATLSRGDGWIAARSIAGDGTMLEITVRER